MTRIVVDKIETQEDRLQFGDPIDCEYRWLEPDRIDTYGDSVRHLATKVELAADGFARTANLSEDVFAGEAADTLRDRAGQRHDDSALVRDNLSGLGRAINAYSDVLRRHRQSLEELRAFGASKGLDLRGNRIFAPVETIADDAPQKELAAWESHWKSYRACFDMKIELRDARRASTRELVRALSEFADVHPDKDKGKRVAANAKQVSFGKLRREAADEAIEAVQATHRVEEAHRTVVALKSREQVELDSLKRMIDQERSPEEIHAQADRVATIHSELGEARTDAHDAATTAEREQAQANRAARNLENAQAGKPSPVVQPVQSEPIPEPTLAPTQQPVDEPLAFNPATHLKDRLG